MRHVCRHCAFVLESHYRGGWGTAGQSRLTSLAYSLLRTDWESGQTTTVLWREVLDGEGEMISLRVDHWYLG